MKEQNESCDFPKFTADAPAITGILNTARVVAVVGLSPDAGKPSHRVARYLKEHGYRIIPVNPYEEHILGERSYPSLREVPEQVDVVDIFRKPSAIPDIVEAAIDKKAKVVWMQEGIVHNAAAERARSAGLKVVMSRCMMTEHAARNPAT